MRGRGREREERGSSWRERERGGGGGGKRGMPAFCSNFLQRQTQTNSIGQLKAEWGRDVRGGGIQERQKREKQLALGSLYFEASLRAMVFSSVALITITHSHLEDARNNCSLMEMAAPLRRWISGIC